MATKQKIFQECPHCIGEKQLMSEGAMIECDWCKGKGHIYWGYLRIPNTPEEE